jgi:DNA-binding transcriptional LysR family regulator
VRDRLEIGFEVHRALVPEDLHPFRLDARHAIQIAIEHLRLRRTHGNQDAADPDFCARYPRLELSVYALPLNDVVGEVAEGRAHIGLAYSPPAHPNVEYRASSPQPVVLLVRRDHPLALRGGAVSVSEMLDCPLALMQPTFGLGQIVQMLAYTDNIQIRATLTTNSLTVLKRLVMKGNDATLIGQFGAMREIAASELVALQVDNPLFLSAKARILVRTGRPLGAASEELLRWMLARMPMFSAAPA